MTVLNDPGSGNDHNACHDCRHYRVTWDSRFPFGCRAHAFKSKRNPALEVRAASGIECMLFAPKPICNPEDRGAPQA